MAGRHRSMACRVHPACATSPTDAGRAFSPPGKSTAWRSLYAGWDPAREGGDWGNGVSCKLLCWKPSNCERRGRRGADIAGTARPAGRMLLVGATIAGHVMICGDAGVRLCGRLGHRHRHLMLVAVIHDRSFRACRCGMRHSAWRCDRGGDALHGQRHDQYP